ncbi:Glutamate 5-kinase [Pseudoclavibacter triregionum]|nr:Glutamate 5-kinase [Pseudoclavibacter triregionum]
MTTSSAPAPSQAGRAAIASAKRIVVKIGSSSLTNAKGRLDVAALRRFVDVLAERKVSGTEIVLVTSGAVAAGMGPLELGDRPRDVATVQAVASVGQGMLIAQYADAFAAYDLRVGQLLLTAEDTVRRSRYRNAGRTIERLLALGAVPIINENDALVADELRFGDNDRIAALITHLVRAEALVLLTDVDGLYDGPPSRPGARRIPEVASMSELGEVEIGGSGSKVGTGGMVTKLQSAAIATESGAPVVLTTTANARAALAGEPVGTCFAAAGKRRSRRQLWLAHAAQTHGRLRVDAGAAKALRGGRASLLAAGIVGVDGELVAGDPVSIVGPDEAEIARGIIAYDAAEVREMLGKSTSAIVDELGEGYGRAIVHLDDLVLVR